MLLLAQTAAEWKVRPSELLRGGAMDLQIDLAAAACLWKWRERMVEEERERLERANGYQ